MVRGSVWRKLGERDQKVMQCCCNPAKYIVRLVLLRVSPLLHFMQMAPRHVAGRQWKPYPATALKFACCEARLSQSVICHGDVAVWRMRSAAATRCASAHDVLPLVHLMQMASRLEKVASGSQSSIGKTPVSCETRLSQSGTCYSDVAVLRMRCAAATRCTRAHDVLQVLLLLMLLML
jgi:hypothetical protein